MDVAFVIGVTIGLDMMGPLPGQLWGSRGCYSIRRVCRRRQVVFGIRFRSLGRRGLKAILRGRRRHIGVRGGMEIVAFGLKDSRDKREKTNLCLSTIR